MRAALSTIAVLLIITATAPAAPIAAAASVAGRAAATGAAGAGSIAYVDGGGVWLSSLDGAQKVRLAAPVVNGDGQTENWLAVAAADSGRIVAVRNVPGRISNYSWFKIWEPDGTSNVEGPLNAPSGWSTYVYPLGFDITADGKHLVYGYSNASLCCPITFARGTYVRPATNSTLAPINISGLEHPSLFGSRVIAHDGATVDVQSAASSTYGTDFVPWLDTSGTGLELRRTDIAANGQLVAMELVQWNGGSQTIGKIAVLSIAGPDQPPSFPAAVDCLLPASGIAGEVSLSQDATRVAWTDGDGLKVAGTPAGSADPCALSAPPIVISPTATQGAIGGASISAFLPAAPPALVSGTAVRVDPGSTVVGSARTVTASVTSPVGVPSGTVTFTVGTSSGAVPLVGGKATWRLPALPVGSHSVSAVYSGDSAFAASASPAVSVVITKATSKTSGRAKVSGKTKKVAKKVTLTLSMTSVKGVSLAGKVSVTVKGVARKAVTAAVTAAGKATVVLRNVKRGKYTAKVRYAGNGSVIGSAASVRFRV